MAFRQPTCPKGSSLTIMRSYSLEVAPESTEAFLAALRELVAVLESVQGFEGAELSRNIDAPDDYVFTERWSSLADHRNGAEQLPGTIFKSLMSTLAKSPNASYLAPILW